MTYINRDKTKLLSLKPLQKYGYNDDIGQYKLKCNVGDIIISQNGEITGIFSNVGKNSSRGKIFHQWPEFVISCFIPSDRSDYVYITENSGDDDCYNWPNGYRFANTEETTKFLNNLKGKGYLWDYKNLILYKVTEDNRKLPNKAIKFKKSKSIVWDITHGFIKE